jgi:putative spermidine/putrescine transport system permease protein
MAVSASAEAVSRAAPASGADGGSLISAATLIGPATLFTVVGLLLPLVLLFRYSLNLYDPTEFMIETVSLANYVKFFSDPYYLTVFGTTI